MNNKNFNIDKAKELCLIYHKKRHYAKEKFVKILIDYQHFFGDTSIMECNLSTPSNFQKRTVEAVCNDLGYRLVEFSHHKMIDLDGGFHGIDTEFTFTW